MRKAAPSYDMLVRPRSSLLRNSFLSVLLFSIPLYGALYVLGIPRGSWLVVLGTQVLGAALCVMIWLRYRSIFIAVGETTIEEQGMFLRNRAMLNDVHMVTLAETYRASSAETWSQLLVTDGDGRRLLRMHGVFWAETEIRRVADAMGKPLTIPPEPTTNRAFLKSHPGCAEWYENRPVLAGIGVAVVMIAAVGIVVGLMALAGVPIGGTI